MPIRGFPDVASATSSSRAMVLPPNAEDALVVTQGLLCAVGTRRVALTEHARLRVPHAAADARDARDTGRDVIIVSEATCCNGVAWLCAWANVRRAQTLNDGEARRERVPTRPRTTRASGKCAAGTRSVPRRRTSKTTHFINNAISKRRSKASHWLSVSLPFLWAHRADEHRNAKPRAAKHSWLLPSGVRYGQSGAARKPHARVKGRTSRALGTLRAGRGKGRAARRWTRTQAPVGARSALD
jgi:hypothetical protein